MKRKYIIYGLIFVLILGGGLFLNSRKSRQNILQIKASAAEVGEIKSYLSTTGKIHSKNKREYFGRQAEIKTVHVKVGDRVKKGDILVTYNTQDLTTNVNQAQIQYDNAILQKKELIAQNDSIKSKIADLDRQISELEKSTEPQDKTKLETLKQQRSSLSPVSDEKLKQSDNSVKLAKLSLDSAKQNNAKNKNTIAAEAEGVVTQVNAVAGAMGNGAQVAVVVQDTDNLKVVLQVGKFDAAKISLGQEVVIKNGGNTYSGKVSFIDPAAKTNVSSGGSETTLGVEVDIMESTPELKIDFEVDLDILLGQVNEVIKLPAESIKTEKGNRSLVYVLEGDIAKEREVKTGIQSDREVEIKEGINKGDRVILNPSAAVRDGVKVVEASGGKLNAGGK